MTIGKCVKATPWRVANVYSVRRWHHAPFLSVNTVRVTIQWCTVFPLSFLHVMFMRGAVNDHSAIVPWAGGPGVSAHPLCLVQYQPACSYSSVQ